MKCKYIKPSTKAIQIKTRTMMLAGTTWNKDEQAGINPNPGSEGDFGAKEDYIDFGW